MPPPVRSPRELRFRGANWAALTSDDPEVLLAGPAGTGKSVVMLWKVRHIAETYPGARILICRKTRASLTETALVTWEAQVLEPGHAVLTKHPTLRRVRQSYRFPNGSEVVVAGMDKPEKVLSAEYDVIYCQEATELTLTDWETLGSRLRNGKTPRQQMLADCNPTTPTHWLYKRHQAGQLTLLTSTHRDNPRFYDIPAKDWTADGKEYLARLARLTGVRRKRFLDGLWVAAEGLVYDQFDPAVHVLPADTLIPREWKRYLAIDFGFVNPLVVQWWAVDPAGRLYLYRETYRTGRLVEDEAADVKLLITPQNGLPPEEPRPVAVIADHDAEGRATFERHSGLTVTAADKKVGVGIQDVAGRLDPADDGKPRLFVLARTLRHLPDRTLADAGKPTCTREEFAAYRWDTSNTDRPKDVPEKEFDHGADAARYVCRYLAANRRLTAEDAKRQGWG